jgi:hypothetical protein
MAYDKDSIKDLIKAFPQEEEAIRRGFDQNCLRVAYWWEVDDFAEGI